MAAPRKEDVRRSEMAVHQGNVRTRQKFHELAIDAVVFGCGVAQGNFMIATVGKCPTIAAYFECRASPGMAGGDCLQQRAANAEAFTGPEGMQMLRGQLLPDHREQHAVKQTPQSGGIRHAIGKARAIDFRQCLPVVYARVKRQAQNVVKVVVAEKNHRRAFQVARPDFCPIDQTCTRIQQNNVS